MRSTAWVLKLYLDFFGDTIIETTSDVFGLNVYGSIKNDDTLALVVINKNLDSAYTATINLHGFISNDTMQVWDITNDTTLTAPLNGTKGIIYRGKYSGDSTGFTYTFPKASVPTIWITPKTSRVEEIEGSKFKIQSLEAYPNPSRSGEIIIRYSVNDYTTNDLRLTIHDIAGRLIRTFTINDSRITIHEITWDRKDNNKKRVANGIYFCRLEAGGKVLTKKMCLVR